MHFNAQPFDSVTPLLILSILSEPSFSMKNSVITESNKYNQSATENIEGQ